MKNVDIFARYFTPCIDKYFNVLKKGEEALFATVKMSFLYVHIY